MAAWLADNQVEYLHMPQLGGRRRVLPEITSELIEGWTHIAFRNYAAYTLTQDYEKGMATLIEIAQHKRVCIMCAESVPWKCHMLIISNSLHFKGVKVFHILAQNKCIQHEINKFGAVALLKDGKVIYPKN